MCYKIQLGQWIHYHNRPLNFSISAKLQTLLLSW